VAEQFHFLYKHSSISEEPEEFLGYA